MQQLRGTSFSAWHWSKHGKGGKDGQRHDKGTKRALQKENSHLLIFKAYTDDMKTNVSVDLFQDLTSAVYFPQSGSCEVITEEAAAALRKANKWAQSGLIVSVGPPVETLVQEAAGGITTGDKKKTAQTAVCRDRNADLARCENKNKHRIVITRFVH